MQISIIFTAYAHKFYQEYFRNDYYYLFNEMEKKELREYIEKWKHSGIQ